MREREVVEPNLLGHLAGGREQADEQFAEVLGANAVEVVLAFATRLDETGDAEQSQVVADRRLALAEPGAEVGDVELAVLGEVEQDPEPGLIAQELENLGEFANGLFRDGGITARAWPPPSLDFFDVGFLRAMVNHPAFLKSA